MKQCTENKEPGKIKNAKLRKSKNFEGIFIYRWQETKMKKNALKNQLPAILLLLISNQCVIWYYYTNRLRIH